MQITVLVDNKESWFMPHAIRLVNTLKNKGHRVVLAHDHKSVKKGDCLLLLSCMRIVVPEILQLNTHNIVVHESRLPLGRGFAPFTWQILEGKNKIWLTLFEAAEKVDSGHIYFQEHILFEGHELHDELKERLALKTVELILKFFENYSNVRGIPQRGKTSWYRRRTPADSELDVHKTIKEQFNLLRVVDNERYPAFFWHKGKRYILKISKQENIHED